MHSIGRGTKTCALESAPFLSGAGLGRFSMTVAAFSGAQPAAGVPADPDVLPADLRFNAPAEVLAGQDFVQVARNLWEREWVIEPGDASTPILKETVMTVS